MASVPENPEVPSKQHRTVDRSRRLVLGLICGTVISGVFLFGLYAWKFWGELSNRQDVWAQFGDFFGGVLNPIAALATLVVVAISLDLTVKALRHTERATRLSLKQYNLLEKQFYDEIKKYQIEKNVAEHARKRELTLRMHQIWIDPGMQQLRSEALEFLQKWGLLTSRMIYMGRYRASDSEKELRGYSNLRSIWEFLENLYSLDEFSMLDRTLALRLFGASLELWVDLNNRMSLLEEGVTSEQNISEDLWFQARVRPFGARLRLWKELDQPASDTGSA